MTEGISIRRYEPYDREAVRRICLEAATEQADLLLRHDRELNAMLFLDYYLDQEDDCCFVAEADARLVGYIAGCKETSRYEDFVRLRIAPRVLLRIARKIITLQYRSREVYRALWCHLVERLHKADDAENKPSTEGYPAHSHFNVDADFRDKGIGYLLGVALEDHLRKRGVRGIHAVVVELAGGRSISHHLIARRGYRLVSTQQHRILRRMTGREYLLKTLVRDFD